MTDLFTMLIVALGVLLAANVAFYFINAHMYKVWVRAMKIKLASNKSRGVLTIPLYTEVYIGYEGSAVKGSVIWSAKNQIQVLTEKGETFYCNVNSVIHVFKNK